MTARYPLMLFRPGTQYRVWGLHDVDTRVVADDGEELSAKEEGWSESPAPLSPLDHDRNGQPGGSLPRRGRRKKEAE